MPSDNRFVQVITPSIMRARELMNIYNDLKATNMNMEERLTILLNTKITVFNKKKSQIAKNASVGKFIDLMDEILELIQREADLLNRGRPEKSLIGLRLRLSNLFLQFIEIPESNPDAAEYQKVPTKLLQNDLEKAKLNATTQSADKNI